MRKSQLSTESRCTLEPTYACTPATPIAHCGTTFHGYFVSKSRPGPNLGPGFQVAPYLHGTNVGARWRLMSLSSGPECQVKCNSRWCHYFRDSWSGWIVVLHRQYKEAESFFMRPLFGHAFACQSVFSPLGS